MTPHVHPTSTCQTRLKDMQRERNMWNQPSSNLAAGSAKPKVLRFYLIPILQPTRRKVFLNIFLETAIV